MQIDKERIEKYNAVVDGYMDVFRKSREHHVLSDELISHLQPFLSFRNMLDHQYWRVRDQKSAKWPEGFSRFCKRHQGYHIRIKC